MPNIYNKINYPITYKMIDELLEVAKSNYRINPEKLLNIKVGNKNEDIHLICTSHDNHQFKSKLRYLTTDSNKNTGQCKACMSISGDSRSITRFELEKIYRNHPIHPVMLKNNEFKQYDIIKKKLPLDIICLYCGYDKQKVSYLNFVAKDIYDHKCFNCIGCAKNRKYSCDLKDKEIFIFFNKLNYNVDIEVSISKKKILKRFIISNSEIVEKLTYSNFKKKYKVLNKKYSNYEKHKKIANSKELKLNVEFSNYHGVTTNDKINYYPFECLKSNHTFERSLCWYSYNNNCPICAREKHDLEIFKSFEKKVNQRGGIVLEKSIATKDQRIKCLCKYKHNFNISHEKLKIGQWCGSCSRGVGERKCRAILEHILGINLPTKHPKILKNPKTGKCLQLDGFNEEHKIAFEYQGPHHKKHHVKIRDNFKKKVCKENGIVLIIIEEFKQNCSDKEKFTIILKKCKALKLNILNDRNNVDLSNTYTNENSVRNRIQRLLDKHNAKALIPFEDISVQMLIKCRNPNHKPFLMTPNNIIYHNGWCNECKKEFSKTVINENKFN